MKPACQAAKTGDKVFLAQVSPVQAPVRSAHLPGGPHGSDSITCWILGITNNVYSPPRPSGSGHRERWPSYLLSTRW